jgi:hypothetical protein
VNDITDQLEKLLLVDIPDEWRGYTMRVEWLKINNTDICERMKLLEALFVINIDQCVLPDRCIQPA